MDNQGHLIQHTVDSIASFQLKIDQKFEEVLMAIAMSCPEEPNGKKSVVEEHKNNPRFFAGGDNDRGKPYGIQWMFKKWNMRWFRRRRR
ncbi:unnamed protein product [Lactuca virosa]|uniref:Uncharacterized protein n=1 Tax=Lactuca virosa TaxID=75947 RepID=A0AAU9NSG4_9ASTR|nr:unnamed protein product [Lactuca virosa]